jgi:hypothetical protein
VSWDQPIYDPIELPKGKKLVTLRDAAQYITELPKAEHDAAEWQAAMEALLLVAEHWKHDRDDHPEKFELYHALKEATSRGD